MKETIQKKTIQLSLAECMWLSMVVNNILKCKDETDITKYHIFFDHIKWGAWILEDKVMYRDFFDEASVEDAKDELNWIERAGELKKEVQLLKATCVVPQTSEQLKQHINAMLAKMPEEERNKYYTDEHNLLMSHYNNGHADGERGR